MSAAVKRHPPVQQPTIEDLALEAIETIEELVDSKRRGTRAEIECARGRAVQALIAFMRGAGR